MSEPGVFVAMVGPSGAGKDTLLSALRARLPAERFHFAQRVVTREPDATEASLALSPEAFEAREAQGGFLISWRANDLAYGIDREAGERLARGQHVVANLSRAALARLRERVPRLFVMHVTADPAVLAERLAQRAREDAAARQARLARSQHLDAGVSADVRIENNRSIEGAIRAAEAALRALDPPV